MHPLCVNIKHIESRFLKQMIKSWQTDFARIHYQGQKIYGERRRRCNLLPHIVLSCVKYIYISLIRKYMKYNYIQYAIHIMVVLVIIYERLV